MIPSVPFPLPRQNQAAIDNTGDLTDTWWRFLQALWNRTGGGSGVGSVGTYQTPNSTFVNDVNLWNLDLVATAFLTPLDVTQQQMVINQNLAQNLTIKPPTGFTIDGGASYTLPPGKMQIFTTTSPTTIVSLQLG